MSRGQPRSPQELWRVTGFPLLLGKKKNPSGCLFQFQIQYALALEALGTEGSWPPILRGKIVLAEQLNVLFQTL